MPNCTNHSAHCFKMYGVDGSDVHAWMDEPAHITSNHRRFRHHPAQEIPKIFIDKYGEDLARNIILDHIFLDGAYTNEKYNREVSEEERFVNLCHFAMDNLFDECPYERGTKYWFEWHTEKESKEIALIEFQSWLKNYSFMINEKEMEYYFTSLTEAHIDKSRYGYDISTKQIKYYCDILIKNYLKENGIKKYLWSSESREKIYLS